jgi:hypothetical protein
MRNCCDGIRDGFQLGSEPVKNPSFQRLSCPRQISTVIEYSLDTDDLAIDCIIGGKSKSRRKTAIISKNNVVDSGVEREGLDIRKQRI